MFWVTATLSDAHDGAVRVAKGQSKKKDNKSVKRGSGNSFAYEDNQRISPLTDANIAFKLAHRSAASVRYETRFLLFRRFLTTETTVRNYDDRRLKQTGFPGEGEAIRIRQLLSGDQQIEALRIQQTQTCASSGRGVYVVSITFQQEDERVAGHLTVSDTLSTKAGDGSKVRWISTSSSAQ